jgi:RNA polymerase sigma-70 factor (ECF subfamily)
VRLSRARKKIGDYLAPRCEHVNPRNPCHCPSRIGVALRKGFIAPPLNAEVTLRKNLRPFDGEIKSHDAVNIFRTLPEVEVPEALVTHIRASLHSGHWDEDKT